MKWKDVKGYEGKYQVSDTGIVRKYCGKEIGQWQNSNGYMVVRLANPRKQLLVHRMVAEVFLDNLNRERCINHKNFIRHDNKVENLEWCSQSYNIKYSKNLDRYKDNYWKGKRSPNAKLNDEAVFEIKDKYKTGLYTYTELANLYKTSKRTIGRIINGKSYMPLPKQPE